MNNWKRTQWLITGANAAAYLQNLLTADVLQLPQNRWVPAAHCTPQGKVLAVFLLARIEQGFVLIGNPETAEFMQKRLAMFSLNQAVNIAPFDAQLKAAGGTERSAQADGTALTLGGLKDISAAGWIAAGIADIGTELQDQYLPQQLGFEENGGLSYTKGCYIGQEAVARAHYKGAVNRHLHRLNGSGTIEAGSRLTAGEHNAGTVILADTDKALAVVQDRYQTAALTAGSGSMWQVLE